MTDTVGRRRINAVFLSIGSQGRHHPVERSLARRYRSQIFVRENESGQVSQRLQPQPSYPHRSLHMADPLSLTTGIISLLTLAIKLVVGAAGLIDKTTTAHREAANELRDLEWDLGRLDRQMDQIHSALKLLTTNTKDRTFKKLLQE